MGQKVSAGQQTGQRWVDKKGSQRDTNRGTLGRKNLDRNQDILGPDKRDRGVVTASERPAPVAMPGGAGVWIPVGRIGNRP